MNNNLNLVTTCNFRGREYLVGLRTVKQSEIIEVKATDKKTAEEWIGTYNATYIENLTHKTGNYKRFETFISMLKSGLLNTSACVALDLLKFEDLEMLRSRTSQTRCFNMHSSQVTTPSTNNRRYLIVTYTVEFDRIHYPLALEYCGPPDPSVLQETIQRLEKQVAELQFQLNKPNNDWAHIKSEIDALQKKVVAVTTENIMLKQQIEKLSSLKEGNGCNKEIDTLLKYTYNLEHELQFERGALDKLKKENFRLSSQLEDAVKSEKCSQSQFNRVHLIGNNLKTKDETLSMKHHSPKREFLKNSCPEKPFSRKRPISKERKVCSARSRVNLIQSSSDESVIGNKRRSKADFGPFTSPRSRASSPSLSEFSHNSEISRCACRNCLNAKFVTKEGQVFNSRTGHKSKGRAKLLRRIQSLEKLINGIVLT